MLYPFGFRWLVGYTDILIFDSYQSILNNLLNWSFVCWCWCWLHAMTYMTKLNDEYVLIISIACKWLCLLVYLWVKKLGKMNEYFASSISTHLTLRVLLSQIELTSNSLRLTSLIAYNLINRGVKIISKTGSNFHIIDFSE